MSEYAVLGIIGLIILTTHFQEAITGFGCTALALPFVLLLVDLDTAVKSLCIMAWLLAFWLVIIARKDIIWKEYWHIVIPMAIGLVIGILIKDRVSEYWLKWVLAVFMTIVGIRGVLMKPNEVSDKPGMSRTARLLYGGFVPAGGLMQGIFASGGPLLVIYATKALPRKGIFRVTLCMVWTTINAILITQWAVRGMLNDVHVWKIVAVGIPFSMLGMVLGNRAHHRVNEFNFRRIVYAVLVLSGIILAYPLVPKLSAVLPGH